MTVLQALALYFVLVLALVGLALLLMLIIKGLVSELRKRQSNKVTVEGQENVEKAIVAMADAIKDEKKPKLRCYLIVTMRNGNIYNWHNSSWDGVAKEFYRWYFGRSASKCFIMKAWDENGSTTRCMIRSEIVMVETKWDTVPEKKEIRK